MGSSNTQVHDSSISGTADESAQTTVLETVPARKRFETILLMSALSVRSLEGSFLQTVTFSFSLPTSCSDIMY